jgi:hypothetical protein
MLLRFMDGMMRSLAKCRNRRLMAIDMPRGSSGGGQKVGVVARLDRAIQYSETVVIGREAAAYWMPRLRGA